MTEPILDVRALYTSFFTASGEIPAVRGVDFQVYPGEVVGIVGESGCGKSVTSLSIMDLLPSPPGDIVSGDIWFKDENLITASEKRMREIRGYEMSMIYQEPMTSLNPVMKIGRQLVEGIRVHEKVSKRRAFHQAVAMLEKVGMPRPEQIMKEYPHRLSGGMRQRVMIAMAMVEEPDILIADEPTTALDVTIQAQILQLMKRFNTELGTAVVMITHDLGVISEVCDRVIVMYAGEVVEEGKVSDIFHTPKHPYTEGLLQSVPDMRKKSTRLHSIDGQVPSPGNIPEGCAFASRCRYVFDRCRVETPSLFQTETGQQARCFLHDPEEKGVGQ